MKKFSDDLSKMLTAFVVTELASKAIDGINYALKIKGVDNEDIFTYCKIREEADKCGYDQDEVFVVQEYVNGYSFEIDPSVTNKITTELALASCNVTGRHKDIVDFVINKSNKRREAEAKALANRVLKEFKENKREITIVLYNMNVNRYTKMIAKDEQTGEKVAIVLNSYSLRLSDIEYVNRKYLINRGLRISTIKNSYILKKTNGVSVDIEIEEV